MRDFPHGDLPVDGLLRRAARRHPEGVAVRTATRTLRFAELDAYTDRIAGWLGGTAGAGPGTRVGVAHVLAPDFAAAYHGAIRAGATVVLINPLTAQEGLRHVLAAGRVEIALVPSATAPLINEIRHALPSLRAVVVTDTPDGVVPDGTVPLHAALDEAGPWQAGPAPDPGAVACVQFTTGTTGAPKGVLLTHRNLVANARQTALAHGLSADSITLNHLPLYHVMHLNSALYAGACQVLCQDPDPMASLTAAADVRATHYYGLPARLHALAADERLARGIPRGLRLSAVLSGGAALRPQAARTLQQRLRVPVIQGYGMAELSPLTHCQRPGRYRPGTVGTVVADTECRLVDLMTGRPVGPWATGEVQIRGPQLMAGYLDEGQPARIDADGWFATGDVGYADDEGNLRLIDRLTDVFTYDNEIVSPSHVEQILADDPRVADCVVADWPDPEHGALVWAGIVLHPGAGADPHTPAAAPRGVSILDVLDAVTERANERLSPFERIRVTEALDAVPRTRTGKTERRAVRQRLKTRAAP
ncbi:class I adenylate-forming enzyme family protein [Streptomyces sp. NBC_01089]|uniref:class I adenylate-forming enzyme family protein n=1 Tax=Streptomyces sp. NBC_01089 TaxID=2903747 RepID=UPI00386F7A96|nr:AMP-binding protein [Streptomyces sp. NBC_01089]WSU46291.1 AMP-binding protein [Streptomyces sp. NBC_01089]